MDGFWFYLLNAAQCLHQMRTLRCLTKEMSCRCYQYVCISLSSSDWLFLHAVIFSDVSGHHSWILRVKHLQQNTSSNFILGVWVYSRKKKIVKTWEWPGSLVLIVMGTDMGKLNKGTCCQLPKVEKKLCGAASSLIYLTVNTSSELVVVK